MRRFSISQVTTLTSSFAEDLETYTTAGADAVGVWELKLGDGGDAEALERFEASGLGSAAAVPRIPSILPLPLMEGPTDSQERVEALARRSTGLRRSGRAASSASPDRLRHGTRTRPGR